MSVYASVSNLNSLPSLHTTPPISWLNAAPLAALTARLLRPSPRPDKVRLAHPLHPVPRILVKLVIEHRHKRVLDALVVLVQKLDLVLGQEAVVDQARVDGGARDAFEAEGFCEVVLGLKSALRVKGREGSGRGGRRREEASCHDSWAVVTLSACGIRPIPI